MGSIIDTAYKYMGVPYVWGGTTPKGFDCSGFTQYVFKQHGISIPRVTQSQVLIGSAVSKSNLKKNDLVFFDTYTKNGHVGIYIGAGNFIHASSSSGVTVGNINSSYWKKKYSTARRITTEGLNNENSENKGNDANQIFQTISNFIAKGFILIVLVAFLIFAVYKIYMEGVV
jgi:hypothetical protein